jgi:hypothetical protein
MLHGVPLAAIASDCFTCLAGAGMRTRPMSPLRRLVKTLCWLAIAGSYLAAIVPQRDAPHLGGSDKMEQMAPFHTMSILARLGYPRVSVPGIFISLAIFGGLIEFSQMLPMIHRDAEWGDWGADIAAAAFGLLLAWPLAILADRRRRQRAAGQS